MVRATWFSGTTSTSKDSTSLVLDGGLQDHGSCYPSPSVPAIAGADGDRRLNALVGRYALLGHQNGGIWIGVGEISQNQALWAVDRADEGTFGPSAGADPIRVVIVDDHQMVAAALAAVIGQQPDMEVVGRAGSIGEVVALLERVRPDVLIADYDLPDGDGVGLARTILATNADLRVLLLTGFTGKHIVSAAMEAGCAGFLTKGRPLSELVRAVRTVHRGDAYVPSDLLAGLLPQLRGHRRTQGADPTLLTAREVDVLALMATGASNQAIADELLLSINTVRNHVKRILAKLGAHSKLQAVAIALRTGVIERPR